MKKKIINFVYCIALTNTCKNFFIIDYFTLNLYVQVFPITINAKCSCAFQVSSHSNMSLLHLSIFFNNTLAFRRLSKLEIPLHEWGLDNDANNVLHLACEVAEKEKLMTLFTFGQYTNEFLNSRNSKERSSFYNLCYRGSYTLVQEVISAVPEIDIDSPCDEGNTPFLMSISSNNLKLARVLQKKGVNINHKNKKGNSALHYAGMKNYLRCAKQLIKWNANINSKNVYGLTPLYFTIKNKNWNIFCIFLDKGANINSRDENGFSLLHHALKSDPKFLKRLLDSGADFLTKDKRGKNVLEKAVQLHNAKAVNIINDQILRFNLFGTSGKQELI